MTINNFNWFLHTLLFLHSQKVMENLKEKERGRELGVESDEEEEDEDDEAGIEIDRYG